MFPYVSLLFQGEYYNQEEVQAMVAAEVQEEEKRKKEEADQLEAALMEMAMAKNKSRRKGPLVASWIGPLKIVIKYLFCDWRYIYYFYWPWINNLVNTILLLETYLNKSWFEGCRIGGFVSAFASSARMC